MNSRLGLAIHLHAPASASNLKCSLDTCLLSVLLSSSLLTLFTVKLPPGLPETCHSPRLSGQATANRCGVTEDGPQHACSALSRDTSDRNTQRVCVVA